MKKGRHRRYEEARQLKRSQDGDFNRLLEDLDNDRPASPKPEHLAWAAEFAEELEETKSSQTRNNGD